MISPIDATESAGRHRDSRSDILLGTSRHFGRWSSEQAATTAAGRAHRAASDAALQACGAIGLTAEHDLNRYVARGFRADTLRRSHLQLEPLLGERLFAMRPATRPTPAIVARS
ncbi:hypothetical protein [Mycobacterium sp. HUMS_1102779]|uniref:hypothetical protein n=1 Tax=Mycobacterium sp. HUMS_1102779 TaxID=3383487 RepID=UPI00389A45F1